MGFFQGVARAYGEISERKEREKTREEELKIRKLERAEDKADRYAYADYTSNLGIHAALTTERLKGSRGSGGSSGAKVEEVANALSSMKTIGLDEGVISKLEGSGNPTAILNANKELIRAYTIMRANGMDDAAISDHINTEVLNWDFSDPSTNVIEFDGEEYEQTVPGAVGVRPVVVVENLDVSELTKVEERILSSGVNRLNVDKKKVTSALTTLIESESQWDNNRDYYEATLNFLTKKQLELDNALNAYSDGDYSGVLQLTGRGPVEETLKRFGGRNQISDVFLDESIPEQVEPWRYEGEGSEVINQTLKNLGVL